MECKIWRKNLERCSRTAGLWGAVAGTVKEILILS